MLEAYEREQNRWALIGSYAGDAKVRVPPFDAIEIELGGLWELEPMQ